nr:MAG: ORF1 [TTV-like mini virus]
MPYYWRKRRYNHRRRYWFTPWRTRYAFRRRRRWRRPRRVRRKLKKIKLSQFQPSTIKLCTVKGLQPAFLCNKKRLSNNYRQTEQSLVPEWGPGGGGFSITTYSLDALYEQHELDRNWWTKSNMNLPLVRFLGGNLKCYKSADTDWVVKIHTCFPMLATDLLYVSCQPSMLMMSSNSYIIPSKKTEPRGKSYKKIKIPVPSQLTNKWYFTKDVATTKLVLITAAACSIDNYYISTSAESNNISFISLNPHLWQLHNFQIPGVDGYSIQQQGTTKKYLWATTHHSTDFDVEKVEWSTMIYLGDSKNHTLGTPVGQNSPLTHITNHKNWGNPFTGTYLSGTDQLLYSTKPPSQLLTTSILSNTRLQKTDFQFVTQPLLHTCRYSPDRDTGHETQIYLLSTIRDTSNWDPPHNIELIREGFPLWLNFFGFLDWQRKLGEAVNINRDWVIVIKSPAINPQLPYYIVLDYDFLHDKSPYIPDEHQPHITDTDKTKWFPCTYYQHQTVENFVQTGPGIAKLGSKTTTEAKWKYSFKFKFGGCPPNMDKVTNPTEQPVYPVPNNNNDSYALQNPNQPPETLLYQFDVKRQMLTARAAKRIKTQQDTEKTLLADGTKLQPDTALREETSEPSSEEEETEEKDTQTLLQLLRQQRNKRKRLLQQLTSLITQE